MSDQADDDDEVITIKGRSRSFPAIPLADAIRRAQIVWDFAKDRPVPVAVITARWGYKSHTTGPASVNYAALKKYGLIEDSGVGKNRRGHLTKLAIEILNKPDPTDSIRQAALRPSIMKEFWEKFGRDVPPLDVVHWDYVIEGGFTESGLKDFLRVYRANVTAYDLDGSGSVGSEGTRDDDEDDADEEGDGTDGAGDAQVRPNRDQEQRRRDPRHGVLTIPVPIEGGDPVIVEFPGKIREADWDQFMAVLTVMKPGLVAAAETDD